MPRKSTNSRLARRLFATNEPPSAAEEAALNDIFDAIDDDIYKVYQKIVRLQAAIAQLQATLKVACDEHDQLLDARAAHETIMSPVRRLPSDVVFEILQWASTSNYAVGHESVPIVTFDHREGPWPFMSICRHWRAVITSDARFWSNISISRCGNPAFFLESLQFILGHSKDALLTLRVASVPIHLEKDAMRLLIPHSHRWVDFSLDCYLEDIYAELDKALYKGSVPQLRRLSMQYTNVIIPLSCFEVAPSLQTLRVRLDRLSPNLCCPWKQIRHLHIIDHYIKAEDAVSCLPMMPNLVDCTFDVWEDENPRMTIRMPHLRCLKVKVCRTPSRCIEFLKCFEVPVLEEMNVGESQEEIEAAATLIRRNACPISTLNLQDSGINWYTGIDLTPLSKAASNLTKLTVRGRGFEIVKRLRHEGIFPKLNHLSVVVHKLLTEDSYLWAVTEVVRTRPCLKTLQVSSCELFSRQAKQHFESDLQVYRARGLNAQLELDVLDVDD
ncbi:hypothetical protein C8J56DRAFT_921611 [Mycena floridula]|nr:hypothetical protein C8J56DRAFT_921611 [Mycena floridula]